ncbi:MAG: hypothetical protein GY810_12835 [Aureispira sp.]|nr:hypothetical protein [Aureispira sp.]
MKTLKAFLLGTILLSMTSLLMAQAPEGFNYQGVVRDNGAVLGATPVTIKINIRSTTPTGTVVYSETHSQTTSDYGVFSLTVGEGTVVSGVFANIAWDANSYYTETEIDFGSGYQNMGTTQLMSVPYALHAKTAENGSKWEENGNHLTYNQGNVGIGSSNTPMAQLQVDSIIGLSGANTAEAFCMEVNTEGQMGIYANNVTGSGIPSLLLDDDSKNVGIYTATPEDRLHVVGGGVQVDETTTTPKKNTVYGNALPLAYGYISTTIITSDYGIASVTNPSTGEYVVTLDNSFSGAPVVMLTSLNNSITNDELVTYSYTAPNKINVHISDVAGVGHNSNFSIVVFGTAQ